MILRARAQVLKAEIMGEKQAEMVGDDLDAYDRLVCGYRRF
jgi:hypothetical protein